MHYLKAVKAAGTDDADTVDGRDEGKMPINDFFAKNGNIRADGRMVHDMYLAQVKKPDESKGPWDYYKILRDDPRRRGLPAAVATSALSHSSRGSALADVPDDRRQAAGRDGAIVAADTSPASAVSI